MLDCAVFDFGLEKWYPILRDHTFESEWLDLTWDEVRHIIICEDIAAAKAALGGRQGEGRHR